MMMFFCLGWGKMHRLSRQNSEALSRGPIPHRDFQHAPTVDQRGRRADLNSHIRGHNAVNLHSANANQKALLWKGPQISLGNVGDQVAEVVDVDHAAGEPSLAAFDS